MEMQSPAVKLLVIDIDGTLLNPQKQITPRTMEAIKAAQQAGITVTLATGRRYHNTLPIARELGLDIPLILCDGALIVEHLHETPIHIHTLQAHIAQEAVEILVSHQVQPVVHHINSGVEETWTGPEEYDNDWVTAYFSASPSSPRRTHYSTFCVGQPDPLRVVAFASEEHIKRLIPDVSTLSCSWNLTKRGNFGSAEIAIMEQSCSKASGIIALTSYLKISIEQVMAIGDNNNDVEMLQAVGWGVAMGQASDEVKASADTVTTSNDEDGVAVAIERYALRCESNAASNSFNRSTCL